MSKVISVANQKGGVGKTVTSVNLGIGLAREGYKVLMIDADTQGSMSISLGCDEPDRLDYSLATALVNIINDEPVDVTRGLIHHPEGVDLMPGNIELSSLEISMTGVISRETILKEYVDKAREVYDFIIIDCMPYEMISGHRRLHAAKRAGLRKIPAIIKEMTNDDATIVMVNANMQREEILPSERAFSLKMKMDAMNHRGSRSDLTLSTERTKFHSAESVGETVGLKHSQIHRYIRLTYLIPKLLGMVDAGRLALAVAQELSYFNNTYQQWLWEYIHENGMIKQEQLMDLRQYRDDDSLTQEQMIDILIQKRATPQIKKKVTFNERKLNKYFPAYYSQSEIERIMISLLEEWKRTHESEDT